MQNNRRNHNQTAAGGGGAADRRELLFEGPLVLLRFLPNANRFGGSNETIWEPNLDLAQGLNPKVNVMCMIRCFKFYFQKKQNHPYTPISS